MPQIIGAVRLSPKLPAVQYDAVRRCSHFSAREVGFAIPTEYPRPGVTTVNFGRSLGKQEFASELLELLTPPAPRVPAPAAKPQTPKRKAKQRPAREEPRNHRPRTATADAC